MLFRVLLQSCSFLIVRLHEFSLSFCQREGMCMHTYPTANLTSIFASLQLLASLFLSALPHYRFALPHVLPFRWTMIRSSPHCSLPLFPHFRRITLSLSLSLCMPCISILQSRFSVSPRPPPEGESVRPEALGPSFLVLLPRLLPPLAAGPAEAVV